MGRKISILHFVSLRVIDNKFILVTWRSASAFRELALLVLSYQLISPVMADVDLYICHVRSSQEICCLVLLVLAFSINWLWLIAWAKTHNVYLCRVTFTSNSRFMQQLRNAIMQGNYLFCLNKRSEWKLLQYYKQMVNEHECIGWPNYCRTYLWNISTSSDKTEWHVVLAKG